MYFHFVFLILEFLILDLQIRKKYNYSFEDIVVSYAFNTIILIIITISNDTYFVYEKYSFII